MFHSDAKSLKDKCDKLEAEKNELKTKLDSSVDLDTLHQVKQEKHKLQKEVHIFHVNVTYMTQLQ